MGAADDSGCLHTLEVLAAGAATWAALMLGVLATILICSSLVGAAAGLIYAGGRAGWCLVVGCS